MLGLRGANARQVVDGVRAKLAEIAPTLPPGRDDSRSSTTAATWSSAPSAPCRKALLEAIVLVLVLLLLFLGNLRAALVVALMLPLSALATFILMRQFGMSANLMSLGGLAIAIGMLVDAAVVVVENIVSQLAARAQGRLPRLHLIYRAVREVGAPVTSGIAHHHHRVPAAAHAAGAGGQAVRAGGADHRVRAGRPRCCCRSP